MKKLIRNVLIAVVVLFVVGLVVQDSLIKSGIRKVVRQGTGFDLEVGSVHAGLFSQSFEVRDLKLINPEDFPEANMLDVNQMLVRYDILSVFRDEIHLREVVLDIPRMVVVQKEDGETNLKRLSQAGKEEEEGGQKPDEGKQPAEPKEEKPARKFCIDTLTLRLGTIESHKYVKGQEKPEIKTQKLDVDRTYTNIRDSYQLGTILAMAMIEGMGSEVFQSVNKAFKDNEGSLDKAGKDIERAAKDLGNQLKGLFNNAK